MGDKSNIEWTEATWNPVTGCTKVSPGCAKCYIERTPPFRTKGRYFVRGHIPLVFHDDRLDQPLRWKRPRRIFVNSLSDLFHDDIPNEFIAKVFAVMALAPQHVFQVLTKRPERMRDFLVNEHRGIVAAADDIEHVLPLQHWYHVNRTFPWPLPNVWLGVSVENQHWADVRVPVLLQTSAAIRWVSYEPALGPVNFLPWMKVFRNDHVVDPTGVAYNTLDWIVPGGESGPDARQFDIAWARSVIEQGRVAGVPVFVKQLGAKPVCTNAALGGVIGRTAYALDKLRDRKGGDPSEWPDDIRVREYPRLDK